IVAVPEGLGTDDGPVVVAPTANDRVEPPDEVFLRQLSAVPDEVGQAVLVELHFALAGFDVGLEAQGCAPAVRSRVVLAHGELPNREAQEVKPYWVFLRVQGVTQAGLARLQLQAQRTQPFLDQLLTLLDDASVRVADDEVIGVADQGGFPVHPATVDDFLFGKGSADRCLHAVQGDVRQQRRDDTPLTGSFLGGKEFFPIHHAGFQPTADDAAESAKRVQLVQQGFVVDPIEAFGDIRIQDVLGAVLDARVNGLKRVVAGSSWSKAVAVRLELGFPFGLQGERHQRLRGTIVDGWNAERPLLVAAGFGNPDATDRLWPGIQVEGVDQGRAVFRFEAGDAIDAGSVFAAVVLADTSDGK